MNKLIKSVIMKRQILSLLFCAFAIALYAQDYAVQGVVTSTDDNLPLPGVNIVVKGTTVGTVTDWDGNYSISVPQSGILVFSYIGTKTREVKVNRSGVVNVALEPDSEMLDEVVAIGYGTMKKSDLTGSVASISADQLKKTPAAGIDQALQGRAAGVTVNANSGQPGAGAEVRIRGIGTINGAGPLYVVDGVIVNDINFLSPNDIATTEILKDASSTAIYGSRGANGVILITTNKGSAGRSEVSYNGYVGWQNRWNKLDLMKRDEFVETIIGLKNVKSEVNYYEKNGFNAWLSAYRLGRDPYYPVVMSDKNPNGFNYSEVETDWQDAVFNKNAMIQNHHISIDGGTDKSNYSFSVNYFDQEGTVIGSDYQRITIRANTSFQVKDWLKIGENLSFSKSGGRNAMNNNASPQASVLSAALAMAPWDPVYYPAGTTNQAGDDFGGRISTPSNFKNVTNPMSMVDNSFPSDKYERWVGDVYVELKPLKGLTFRSDISLDLTLARHRLFKPAFELSGKDYNPENFLSRSMSRSAMVIWDNILTYTGKIGNHDFSLMGGTTTEEYNYYSIGGSGSGILNPGSTRWYLNQTTTKRSYAGDDVSRSRRFSFLGRLHYSYLNRYLLTANFRADGTNKFPENTWGYFPSVALGWKISEEGFLADVANLDVLKLRAGWGRIGNEQIGNDRFTQTIAGGGPTFVSYVLGENQTWTNGAAVLTYVNQGGKWEVTETLNLGVDFGLFNGLLSGSVELFKRDTKEMILTVKGPAYVGNRYDASKNVGIVRNQGVELTLDHKNKIGKMNYSIGGNVSFIKNELTDLNGGERVYDGYIIHDKDYSLYTLWGYEYQGVYRSNEEAASHLYGYTAEELPYKAGDAKYTDLNGDGLIDDADKLDMGNPFPWLTYGLNLGLEWKGVDVQLFFQGVAGNEIYNHVRHRTEGKGEEVTLSTAMRNAWTVNNPDGSIPNPYGTSNNYFVSTRFVEDGSYLRLKNMQVGYTLPQKVTSKVGISRCRLYVSASNLLTFTNYTGYDPEVGGGIDYGNYPQARTVMVGLNLNF